MRIRNFQLVGRSFALYFSLFVIAMTGVYVSAQGDVTLTGSFAESKIEMVDIFSGKLEGHLSLFQVGGRGEVSHSLLLPIRNSQWYPYNYATTEIPDPYQFYQHYKPVLGPQLYPGLPPRDVTMAGLSRGGYGIVGKLRAETRRLGSYAYDPTVVTSITFTANDGSIITFRDVLTNGQPLDAEARGCKIAPWLPPPPLPAACSRGRVFRSIDGENATFVADGDVYDQLTFGVTGEDLTGPQPVSGTIYTSNGVKMTFDPGVSDFHGENTRLSKIEDRNGNHIRFEYSASTQSGFYLLTKVTDSLNRATTINYGDESAQDFQDEIVYAGTGGSERKITIFYK
ncbi:MAG: hypothetical protein KF762_15220, partial [Acidobacteria bacterium]|nr:hypothetical protein [Acidobacteriota bacterium]